MIHFGVVSPFVLLIALMASPMLGILFAAVLAQSVRMPTLLRLLAWLPAAFGAGVALIAAWLLHGQPGWEAVVGNWSPVSFTGLPLAMASFTPATAVVIAWVTLYFWDSLKLPNADPFERHPAASALIVASLTITALANNLVTLLIGLGLTDLFSAYLALRRQTGERSMLVGLVLNLLSIVLLTLVVVMHAAEGSSLHLPMTRLSPAATSALALAIALRLGFAPFRTSPDIWRDMRTIASAVGGFLILIRLPTLGITQLPEWFYGLALTSALLTLAIAILEVEADGTKLIPSIATAGAYLAATSAALANPGVTAAAVVAWLIGVTLIAQTDGPQSESALIENVRLAIRIGGTLCLIGLPLTVGFVGQAGVVTTWASRGAIGWLLILAWIVVLALLSYALLSTALDSLAGRTHQARLIHERATLNLPPLREAVGWLVAVLPIVVFGVAPGLLDAGSFTDALGRNDITDWLGWVIAIIAGALLQRFEHRWRPTTHHIRKHAIHALDLGWFYSLLRGAAARLSSPFSRVFTFLESDGALLWAIIVSLLLVLISRPGGP